MLKDGALHLFNANGLLTSAVDRNGNTTAYAYDGAARIQTITDPEGRALAAKTGPFGEPTDVTGYDGLVTDIDRNAEGEPLQVAQPNGVITTASYDAFGNRLSRDDGVGT